jgi:hypothetical protein
MKKGKYYGINPLEKLHPDEPFFFIRAQDKLSVSAVLGYSELLQREADKAYQSGDIRLWESLSDQAAQVANYSRQFLEWQIVHPEFVKLPD